MKKLFRLKGRLGVLLTVALIRRASIIICPSSSLARSEPAIDNASLAQRVLRSFNPIENQGDIDDDGKLD